MDHPCILLLKVLLYLFLMLAWNLFDYKNLEWLFFDCLIPLRSFRGEYQDDKLDLLYKLISELGDKVGLGLLVVLATNLLKQEHAFVCGIASIVSVTIVSVEKLAYFEPRPFFVDG